MTAPVTAGVRCLLGDSAGFSPLALSLPRSAAQRLRRDVRWRLDVEPNGEIWMLAFLLIADPMAVWLAVFIVLTCTGRNRHHEKSVCDSAIVVWFRRMGASLAEHRYTVAIRCGCGALVTFWRCGWAIQSS